MKTKVCSKCNEELPLTKEFFFHNKSKEDGFYDYCKPCFSPYTEKYRKENPEVYRKASAEYRARHPEKTVEDNIKFRTNNPAYHSEWKKTNSDKVAGYTAKRRSLIAKATPPWTTEEMKNQIDFMYWLAKTLTKTFGVEHHVDHIVPLKACWPGTRKRAASGLNVPWNLQVLKGADNLSKAYQLTNVN